VPVLGTLNVEAPTRVGTVLDMCNSDHVVEATAAISAV
jgi:hypothetical protein